jgi:hypothetical protein
LTINVFALPTTKEIPVMKSSAPAFRFLTLLAAGAALALLPLASRAADAAKTGQETTVTGEILDMACYLDHGAQGAKHADCAKTCISSGLPVGIKTADGTVYLLIGEHKPANDKLAEYAAKTVTLKGKLVTRDGINLLENVEIVN